jgi:hypothetical protein
LKLECCAACRVCFRDEILAFGSARGYRQSFRKDVEKFIFVILLIGWGIIGFAIGITGMEFMVNYGVGRRNGSAGPGVWNSHDRAHLGL